MIIHSEEELGHKVWLPFIGNLIDHLHGFPTTPGWMDGPMAPYLGDKFCIDLITMR